MGAALNLFALRKDGSEFPVDIMLKPIQTPGGAMVLSFARDVTEQRIAQEAARSHDLQLRSIVESIRDYAIYLLDPEGHVLTWSPGGERIKGYTADEVLGFHSRVSSSRKISTMAGPPNYCVWLPPKAASRKRAGRVRKDGSRFWANVIVTAIRDSSGTVTGYAKVTRDFTDRKRLKKRSCCS